MAARFVIVAAVDLAETAGGVVERALEEAARRDGAELHFVHVHGGHEEPFDHQPEDAVAALEERLSELVAAELKVWGHDPAAEGPWRVTVHVRTGNPAEEIGRLAGERSADLLVVGRVSGARGASALGSVADAVLRRVGCPVLVVQLPAPVRPRAEAHGLDDDQASLHRAILAWQADLRPMAG